jgi:hypothetical protein
MVQQGTGNTAGEDKEDIREWKVFYGGGVYLQGKFYGNSSS